MALEECMLPVRLEWSTRWTMMTRHWRQLIALMTQQSTLSQSAKLSVWLALKTSLWEFGPWTSTSSWWRQGMKALCAQLTYQLMDLRLLVVPSMEALVYWISQIRDTRPCWDLTLLRSPAWTTTWPKIMWLVSARMAQLDCGTYSLLTKLSNSPVLSISLCVLQHIQHYLSSHVVSSQELWESLTLKRLVYVTASHSLIRQSDHWLTLPMVLYWSPAARTAALLFMMPVDSIYPPKFSTWKSVLNSYMSLSRLQ